MANNSVLKVGMPCGLCSLLTYSVTVRLLAQNNFILLLKSFIIKVLEHKADLNGKIKFVYVALHSLVISLCSHDAVSIFYYNTLKK